MMMSNSQPGGYRPPPGVLPTDRSTILYNPVHHQDNSPPSYLGDSITMKRSCTFCGVSCQLGCLPLHSDDAKHEALVHAISHFDVDDVALQELGINFSQSRSSSQ